MRAPPLADGSVHVWRIPLGDPATARALRPLLSDAERARADRFFAPVHGARFTVAHGALRLVIASYVGTDPATLRFGTGPNGKPFLDAPVSGIAFNLSHSAALAAVAVTTGAAVGIDVERWDADVEHLELAERFFSPAERHVLRALAGDAQSLIAGFFAAWTRKEAYLKATSWGITRGLHHFDVTLAPRVPAQLLADRLDPGATERWAMAAVDVGPEFSGAVVAAAPLHDIVLLDFDHAP